MKALLLGLLACATLLILAGHASAGQGAQEGCSQINTGGAGGVNAKLTRTSGATCTSSSPPSDDAAMHVTAGSCLTLNFAITGGTTTTGVNLYEFAKDTENGHTAAGNQNWVGFIRKVSLGANPSASTQTFCATSDGTSTGAARVGTFQMTVRVCQYVNPTGDGCAGTSAVLDANSFDQGNAGVNADSVVGYYRSGGALSCFSDSTSPGGPDVSTYVSGDVPRLRACTLTTWPNPNNYAMTFSTVQPGGATIATSSVAIAGGTTTTDGSLPAIVFGDSYASGTSPTKRLQVATAVNGRAWTYFTSAPSGATLTSEAQVDAPWGLVDKTLSATCALRDPVSGASMLTPARLGRGEQVQCRGAGAGGLAQIHNARGEDWPTGAFVSVYARRETQPAQDTTDAARCDVTTTAAGTYQCDVALATSSYTNDARVGGATPTTGLGYGVDVAIYQDSARTTLLARAHVASLFDARPDDYSLGSPTGTCSAGPTPSLPTAHRGDTETLAWRLCNARGETISPVVHADAKRFDTLVVDQGVASLSPSGGSYSWTFTATGASLHVTPGYAKTLSVTDLAGNNATAQQAYNVTDLLNVDAIHTWLKSCGPQPEQAFFIIGADTICQNEGVVRDPTTGNAWARSLTFLRWYNDTPDNAALSPDSASGVTTGTSPNHIVTPQPPGGTYTFAVRAYDANGNYGETTKSVVLGSPLSSIFDILCSGTNVHVEPGATMSALCTTMKRDPATSILQAYCSDAAPSYRVNLTTGQGDGLWLTSVPTTPAGPDAATACSYWVNWTAPSTWATGEAATLLLETNFSGLPIHAFYELNVGPSTGSDPLGLMADYSWDTHNATLAATLRWGNGTLRTGMANQLHGTLFAPDGTTSPLLLAFQERGASGTYYAAACLGASPTRGTWLALVTAPQPDGSTTSSLATFSVGENLTLDYLDLRGLQQAFWTAFNASATDLRAHLDALDAHQNQTDQETQHTRGDVANLSANLTRAREEHNASSSYTNSLVNQTTAAATAGAGARTLNITWTSDGDAYTCWAGRTCALYANATEQEARYHGLFWTWDLGDHTTASGPVAYHAYEPGTYTLTARLTDALGGSNTTTVEIQVPTSAPVLNMTGPVVVRPGHQESWTIGTSHDPHDEVAYTIVEDPRLAHIWYVGDKWYTGGYCGSLNATSLAAPDINGLQLGPFQSQWSTAADASCAQINATFVTPGTHHLVLIAVNKHGIERHLDYPILVLGYADVAVQHPYHPGDNALPGVDAKGVTDQTRSAIDGVVRFIHWITGHAS